MSDAKDARNQVCDWLEELPFNADGSLADDQLWVKVQQCPSTIMDIGRAFTWWRDWATNQGDEWKSDKYDIGNMKGTLPLVSSVCKFLQGVGQNGTQADRDYLTETLSVAICIRDEFQKAIQKA
jgi:hypothetical protein